MSNSQHAAAAALGIQEAILALQRSMPTPPYDIALSLDEAALSRVVGALHARSQLRQELFRGSQSVNISGADLTVGWDVLQPPVISLTAPSTQQWQQAIKRDGTVSRPTDNVFVIGFPQLQVSRRSASGETAQATVALQAICTANIGADVLDIDVLAVVVDLSPASPFDQMLFKQLIIPRVMHMANSLLSKERIPSLGLHGIGFGQPTLVIGAGRVMVVANLTGKPTPIAPAPDSLPGGSFYILLSPETMQLVAQLGSLRLIGTQIGAAGKETSGTMSAEYQAKLILMHVMAQPSTIDPRQLNASVMLFGNLSAGVDL